MSPPKVGVIVLHWKSVQDTVACLRSVARLDYAPLETVVVDNGCGLSANDLPTDEIGSITLLSIGGNLGYTGGNNLAINYALDQGCAYVWLLNNDATVAPDALSALMAEAERDPDAGFLGPLVCMREEPERVLSAGGTLSADGSLGHRGLGESHAGRFSRMEEVDYLSGCALLVSRRAIERVGLLDDDFFAYQEDVEWCIRGRRAGFRVLLVPGARVWHPDTRRRDEFSAHVTYYITRNSLIFARKRGVGAHSHARLLGRLGRTLVSWSVRPKWRSKRPQRDAMARGVWDFLRGRVGPMPGTPGAGRAERGSASVRCYRLGQDSQTAFARAAATSRGGQPV